MGSASLQPSHMKVVFFSKVLTASFHPPWATLQILLLSPHHYFICKSPAASSFMPTGKNTQLLYPCCYLPVSHHHPSFTEDVNFWLALITHNDSNINTDDPLSSLGSQFLDLLTPIVPFCSTLATFFKEFILHLFMQKCPIPKTLMADVPFSHHYHLAFHPYVFDASLFDVNEPIHHFLQLPSAPSMLQFPPFLS